MTTKTNPLAVIDAAQETLRQLRNVASPGNAGMASASMGELESARAAATELVEAAKDVGEADERFGFTYCEKLDRLADALAAFEVTP
jgi:hypothetical protein